MWQVKVFIGGLSELAVEFCWAVDDEGVGDGGDSVSEEEIYRNEAFTWWIVD